MQANPIPPAQSRWGKISKGAENTPFAMREIVEGLAAESAGTAEEKNLAGFYSA